MRSTLDMPIHTDWRHAAQCGDSVDPDVFWLTGRKLTAANREALGLCRSCIVRADCYEWAEARGLHEGIAGGSVWLNGKPAKVCPCGWAFPADGRVLCTNCRKTVEKALAV